MKRIQQPVKMLIFIMFIFCLSVSCMTSKDSGITISKKSEETKKNKDISSRDDSSKSEDSLNFATKEKEAGKENVPVDLEPGTAEKNSSTRGRGEVSSSSSSGLKAGFADDNKQFNYFLNFISEYNYVPHYSIPIDERIIIKIKDQQGKPLSNAKVKIFDKGKLFYEATSYADGTVLFFPKEGSDSVSFNMEVAYQQNKKVFTIDRFGKRQIDILFDLNRPSLDKVPLDILFVLDTTGSMGEEIERLKQTIEITKVNISSLSIKPDVRFGMVLYKDRGDEEYVTKVIPLSGNLDEFKKSLDEVEADGGGDIPEDLQAALDDSMNKIKWINDGIRLCFVITDAAPHLDYNQSYTYVSAVKDARKKGIKVFTIGSGELDINGEYVLRQISQYTYAKYIFLTYGESGESEGGAAGSVSHHTGANFQTDKLEAIIIRFTKEELSYLTDKPIEEGEEYFEASKIKDEDNKETITKLFDMAINQLIDYSSINIEKGTPASLIPIISQDATMNLDAEYFTDYFNVSLSRNKTFLVVERKDMQKILDELQLQLSGLVNDESAVKIGEFLGAQLLITGKLYKNKNNYEIFLKLLRVKTSEVLSVTKTLIDFKLGLKSQ